MSRVFDSTQIGANAEVIITSTSAALNNTTAFTVSAWLNPASSGAGGFGTAFVKDPSSGAWPILQFGGSLKISSYLATTGNPAYFAPNESLVANTWTNVVLTYDNAGDNLLHLYLNGVEATYSLQAASTGVPVDNSASGYYFGNDSSGNGFDGDIAEVAVWNSVLTPAQIAAVAASTTGVASIQAADLVGYWHLDGTASPEPDSSGNNNAGVLSTNPPTQGPDSPGYTSPVSISGNVIAVNAKLELRSQNYVDGVAPVVTYSDSNGDYTFSPVAAGSYTLFVTLSECTTTYLPNLYSYRSPQQAIVVTDSLTNVNFTPIAFNANNPAPNAA